MFMRPASAKQIDAGLAVLRVITGIVFAVHGYQKFFMMGLDETAGFFGSLGIPMAELAAPLIATLELAGGIAVALGLLTRPIALLLVFDLLGAIALVHAKNGFFVPRGIEFVLTLMTAALTLALAGPGSASVDRMLSGRSASARR